MKINYVGCTLNKVINLSNSEDLYFNHRPKQNVDQILQTTGQQIPSRLPIALVKILKEDKKHIHFQYDDPPVPTEVKMNQASQAMQADFTFFPERKLELSIPNKIFNKIMETLSKLGAGWSKANCEKKNNHRHQTDKPPAVIFINELVKVAKSVRGNGRKLKDFPQ